MATGYADGERIRPMDRDITAFLQHLIVEKGFSQNTAEAYRNDLNQFWEFLQKRRNGSANGSSNGSTNGSSNGIQRQLPLGIGGPGLFQRLHSRAQGTQGLSRHDHGQEDSGHKVVLRLPLRERVYFPGPHRVPGLPQGRAVSPQVPFQRGRDAAFGRRVQGLGQ